MTERQEKQEARNKLKWSAKPIIFVCDILPGDRITLSFQKHGKLYFKEMEVLVDEK